MSRGTDPAEAPEFTRPVEMRAAVATGASRLVLQAEADERAALARRFGLERLERLEADFRLTPVEGEGVAVAGAVSADVVQACVVTLEPIWSSVKTALEVTYLPEGAEGFEGPADLELAGDPEAAEPPDVLPESGVVDLGELAAQALALALDPYPRKPGVALPPEAVIGDPGASSPFAVLAQLKTKGRAPESE